MRSSLHTDPVPLKFRMEFFEGGKGKEYTVVLRILTAGKCSFLGQHYTHHLERLTFDQDFFAEGIFRSRRNNSRISSMAFGMSSCEVAFTLIQCPLSSGWSFLKVVRGKSTRLSSGFSPPANAVFWGSITPTTWKD